MTKDFNLKREGKNLIYESPELEIIFDKIETRSRYVTLTASASEVEIDWGFTSSPVACGRLQAYKLIVGEDLKVKLEDWGSLVLEVVVESSYIHAKITINSNASINEVIPKALYLLQRNVIEPITMQAIFDLQNKVKEEKGGELK